MTITCVNFKPLRRGSLLGFADLELSSGLVILECSFHEANGRRWVNPPGRPMLDADKRPIVKDGKLQYAPVIEFRDKPTRYRWSDAAVAAIEALESKKPREAGLHEGGTYGSARRGY